MPPTETKDELPDNSGWLVMHHRETGGISRQTRDAFRQNYRFNDWEEVTATSKHSDEIKAQAAELLEVHPQDFGLKVDEYGDAVIQEGKGTAAKAEETSTAPAGGNQ